MLHHRRTTAPAPSSSSKVAASRERRARRKLEDGSSISSNGSHSHHHGKHHGNGMGYGTRLILLTLFSILVGLLLFWGGALYHVATDIDSNANGSAASTPGWKLGKVSLPKNALRRMRNNINNNHQLDNADITNTIDHDTGGNDDPYTLEALSANPHLGWQPPLLPSPLGSSFSWRTCFKADPKNDGSTQPTGCRENPSEFGTAPTPIPNYVTEEGDKIWVPDVTMVRTMMMYGKDRDGNVFPPLLDKELCEDVGVQGGKGGDSNKQCLKEAMIRPTGHLNSTTVKFFPSNHYGEQLVMSEKEGMVEVPAPTIMCLVYTMADAHANRIRAMRDTWAGGCDGFLAFSTESDPRLPSISLTHEGPESYDNMWQKVRSIWKFVGTHYIDQFDWFFIGGDDLFVMPHNLKTYLASLVEKDGTDPHTKEYFVGRRFNSGGDDYFNSGGAGYTLSRATLRKFLENMDDAKHCMANSRTSMEDVMIARCLRYLGIHFTDTRDANGRERFHPFAPGSHLGWKPPRPGQERDWYEDYNKEWGLLLGKDCCAPDSVSFHYVKKASMVRHMQALLYFCDEEN